jgi:hypothetical protein
MQATLKLHGHILPPHCHDVLLWLHRRFPFFLVSPIVILATSSRPLPLYTTYLACTLRLHLFIVVYLRFDVILH